MHVEICDVPCVLVKTLKTQKQIKYKKKGTLNIFSYSSQWVIEWSTHAFISDFLWLSNRESTLPIEKNKVRFVVYKFLGNFFYQIWVL